MFKKIKYKIRKNIEFFILIGLIIITVTSTTFFNYKKNTNTNNYNNFINNIYLKNTLNHIFNNLEPK